MKRREFITLLGGAAAAWPLAARAQQADTALGVLMNLPADDPEAQLYMAAFQQGLQDAGAGASAAICEFNPSGPPLDREQYIITKKAAELVSPLAPDVVLGAGGVPHSAEGGASGEPQRAGGARAGLIDLVGGRRCREPGASRRQRHRPFTSPNRWAENGLACSQRSHPRNARAAVFTTTPLRILGSCGGPRPPSEPTGCSCRTRP